MPPARATPARRPYLPPFVHAASVLLTTMRPMQSRCCFGRRKPQEVCDDRLDAEHGGGAPRRSRSSAEMSARTAAAGLFQHLAGIFLRVFGSGRPGTRTNAACSISRCHFSDGGNTNLDHRARTDRWQNRLDEGPWLALEDHLPQRWSPAFCCQRTLALWSLPHHPETQSEAV